MGVFGAVFGRRGDAGFSGPLLGLSRGDAGFNVALLSSLVREKVRPAWPDGGREREKVRPACSKHPKIGVLWRAGRTYSRKRVWRGFAGRVFSRKRVWRGFAGRTYSRKSRWSGRAGRVCGPAVVGSRASFDATRSRQLGPSTGTLNPSIRSYAHLVVAGCGRPPLAPATLPATQSVDKGKVPSGQGRDKP